MEKTRPQKKKYASDESETTSRINLKTTRESHYSEGVREGWGTKGKEGKDACKSGVNGSGGQVHGGRKTVQGHQRHSNLFLMLLEPRFLGGLARHVSRETQNISTAQTVKGVTTRPWQTLWNLIHEDPGPVTPTTIILRSSPSTGRRPHAALDLIAAF